MSKFEFKSEVYKLRTRGFSIGKIASKLNLSKSTVSLWCSEIKFPKDIQDKLKAKMILAGHTGRLKGAETNKNKKINSIREAKEWAKKEFKDISLREYFIACIALYWAEGSKSESTTGFVFVNSDPKMISFMYKWLLKSLNPINSILVKTLLIFNILDKYVLE